MASAAALLVTASGCAEEAVRRHRARRFPPLLADRSCKSGEANHRDGGPIEQTLRNDWQRLRNASEPNPRALTHWLRKLIPSLKLLAESMEMPATDWPGYSQRGHDADV